LPFDGLCAQGVCVNLDAVGVAIAPEHRKGLILVTAMKPQPQAKPI
jgi:hypothetical protein